MIHQTLKSSENTADIVIFSFFFTVRSNYDLLLNSLNFTCSQAASPGTPLGCKITLFGRFWITKVLEDYRRG